jgi:hypothetical protein
MKNRFLLAMDLDHETTSRAPRPEVLPDLDSAEIDASGKCATIRVQRGVAYIGGHSRCAKKLWQIATGSDNGRPPAPWVAYRGLSESTAIEIGWAWLHRRELISES